ncbi:histidine kinase [Lasius niger]|uniref:Histidine kinase n=1 Tax=Lasius niger TaxID=67767 RepID=A0A0J7KXN6_LASNI|nr:histidine kinase [Lasius niger]
MAPISCRLGRAAFGTVHLKGEANQNSANFLTLNDFLNFGEHLFKTAAFNGASRAGDASPQIRKGNPNTHFTGIYPKDSALFR